MGGFRETKKSRTLSVFHSRPRLSFPPPFHSRESGNLAGRHRPPRIAAGDIALPLRGISRWRGKRFPLSREWNMEREWKCGGAKAGISAAIAAFADRRCWCFRFAEFPANAGRDSRFRGNGIWRENGKVGEWKYFFTPRRLRGGGASAIAVAGGGVFPMMFGTSPPPKNSPCEFLPPPASGGG